jgi:hypothetical protein
VLMSSLMSGTAMPVCLEKGCISFSLPRFPGERSETWDPAFFL